MNRKIRLGFLVNTRRLTADHLRLVCWLHFHVLLASPLTLHALYISTWPTRWYQFGSTCLVCKLFWLRFNIISLKPLWKIGTGSIWISYTFSKAVYDCSQRVGLFVEISGRSSPGPGNTEPQALDVSTVPLLITHTVPATSSGVGCHTSLCRYLI